MPWLITFILSWLLLLIFIDTRRLKYTLWGGLITFMMAALVDWAAQELGLYRFNDMIINLAGSPALYLLGPVFTMGVLFFQFLHRDRVVQAGNIMAFSMAYLAVEYLIVNTGVASYLHWHILASLGVDILAFTSLSYIGGAISERVEGKGKRVL